MTTTTREPGDGTVAGERAWGVVSDEQGGFADDRSDCTDEIAWGTCLSEGDEGYWTRDLEEDWVTGAAPVDTPHTIPNTGAGSDLLSQLKTVRGVLAGVAARLPEVGSAELTQVAAQASAVVAAAEAARAAVVLDADARGVIASSDNPRVDRFVEQACRDAGIPVTTRHAATLKDVASACEGHDVSAVREADGTGAAGTWVGDETGTWLSSSPDAWTDGGTTSAGVAVRDDRTAGQRRADALIMLAGVATRPDGELPLTGAKAKVLVTVSHGALAEQRGTGVTEHGQVLTASEVRMLACDAGIIPVVLGTHGEPLDVGRELRLVTPAQRHALIVRDKGCSFPGCDAPPSWCDAHHLLEWIHGGLTDLDNLALLCRHHHRETHSKGHVGGATRFGVTWTRSDGSTIGNAPRIERCR